MGVSVTAPALEEEEEEEEEMRDLDGPAGWIGVHQAAGEPAGPYTRPPATGLLASGIEGGRFTLEAAGEIAVADCLWRRGGGGGV